MTVHVVVDFHPKSTKFVAGIVILVRVRRCVCVAFMGLVEVVYKPESQ